MRDIYQPPSDVGDGGMVLNMFAQAKTGQLSLMGAVQVESVTETSVPAIAPIDEEAPIETA